MLSIIIPCYNCAKTLQKAVDSIYADKLDFPFEIILVDDCSTDTTRTILNTLKSQHREIKTVFHEKNLGGGATRNTATAHASFDLIFCLDSDDMVGKDMLKRLVRYQQEKKCDAVGISTSIKFKGDNIKNTAFINTFGYTGEQIPFEALLQKNKVYCSLYSTFLYTKKAFTITGGYPTTHGFDTQGFAWRFLSNGLVAYTCPETIYHHRIHFHKSYYLREYESGKINHNWRKIYEEFLYFFNDETKKDILNFDFNDPTKALNTFIEQKDTPFIEHYKNYLIPHTKDVYRRILETKEYKDMYDYYWLGTYALSLNKHKEALEYFKQAKEKGMDFPILYSQIKEVSETLTLTPSPEVLEKSASLYNYTLQGSRAPFLKRLYRKILTLLTKK